MSITNVDIDDLISAPLVAAAKANETLAGVTRDFIEMCKDSNDNLTNIKFQYKSVAGYDDDGELIVKNIVLEIPLISILNIPSLMVKEVDIGFVLELKGTEELTETNTSQFNRKYKFVGNLSTQKEVKRETDFSSTYTFNIKANDTGGTDGLLKVIDLINKTIHSEVSE